MARPKIQLRLVDNADTASPRKQNRINHFRLAYERLEDALVNCSLQPGLYLTMQDLQDLTGFGRTPVHHAVNRLAADTLILIRPRHGLQIAPIDLARERLLLQLRKDFERFVIQLAAERANPSQRNKMLHLERVLRDRRNSFNLDEFNLLDRTINSMVLEAASEPFLEHTLRPLHTLYRRIGYIHHTAMPGQSRLDETVDHHIAVLNAVANRHVKKAISASDALITYVDEMFDAMETGIDPALLDSSTRPLLNT